ncbi:MAG: S8 family serine peptidase [Bacteroidetes bacterium]|nr:S8 family serine peptidase [Bacteroidota bacterium]
MKKILITLIFAVILSSQSFNQNITQQLQDSISNSGTMDLIPISIRLASEFEFDTVYPMLRQMSRHQRREFVVNELKAFANQQQQPLMNILDSLADSNQVSEISPYWIINMVCCNASPNAISQISSNQYIEMIDLQSTSEIAFEESTPIEGGQNTSGCEIPWHISQVHADQVWQMGFFGCGVVVAVIDQGVNYNHTDLQGRMWDGTAYGFTNHGYDFVSNDDDPFPINGASEKHGTHVAGLITGNCSSGYGYSTGVAPESKIMALRVLDGGETVVWERTFSALEFALEFGADIINLSIGQEVRANPDFYEQRWKWRHSLDNVMYAGCIAIAASGNKVGPPISTPYQVSLPACIPSPWKHPDQVIEGGLSSVVAVGATDKDDYKWNLSCEGPVTWQKVPDYNDYFFDEFLGQYGLTKPDVSAPGKDIISTVGLNDYEQWSGTSMSTAIVSGVMSLLLGYNPDLSIEQLDSILELTADKQVYGVSKNNIVGAGRIDAKAALEMAETIQIEINENVSWNSNRDIYSNVFIKSGYSLTISNAEIEMGPGRKIVIEPGATLVVNNGVIRNNSQNYNCTGPWQGIEVWGNSSAHQWPDTNGNYQQGRLVLNNATIENAIVAVNLWKKGDYSKSGGVVYATNSSFINNTLAVHALPYRNFHPLTFEEMPYNALFSNCTFEINADYPGYETFYKHIDLNQVNGPRFKGCDFTLSPQVENVSASSIGIGSYGSGFRVNALCTSNNVPCNDWDRSSFTGFTYGIYATGNVTSNNTFEVSMTDFTNNSYGIKMTAVNNTTILSNMFNIGGPGVDEIEKCGLAASAYGVYTDNCTGFAIEENDFYKLPGAPVGNYIGTYIAETQATDQVYFNTYYGLSYGNYAVGENHVLPDDFFHGLAYYCNENVANFADFYVEPDNDPQKTTGIQSKQGNDQHVTGNKFSPSGATWHFYNGGDYLVGYYYCSTCANENPDDNREFQVTDKPVNIQSDCQSHYGGGSSVGRNLVLTPDEILDAELEFAVNLSNYNSVKTLYENLKDGGNTGATLTDIENASSNEMWELRAKLLGDSPHLSMEVLKAMADKTDVLPDNVIFEILAANPDELKKDELIKYLENKENPLPEYMINILRQVAEGSTYKTVLEQEMAHYNQVKTRAAYDLIRRILNDTVVNNNALRSWLDNIGGKRADEQIISSYLSENNYENALSIAAMMPEMYNYNEYEMVEHAYFMELLNLQILLSQQGRTVFELNSTEVSNLETIAVNSTGTAGALAKGTLGYTLGGQYCNCIHVSDSAGFKSSNIINPEDYAKAFGLLITTEPNPANEWVAFNYTLPNDKSEGLIKIIDSKGTLVTSLHVTGMHGQKVWDTRKSTSGVYFFTMSVGELTRSGKIVISK